MKQKIKMVIGNALGVFLFFGLTLTLVYAVEDENVTEDNGSVSGPDGSSASGSNNGRNMKAEKDEIKTKRETVRTENQERREEFKQEMSETKERRCDLIEDRIKDRIERYETNQEHNRGLFKNLVERVEKLAEKYKAQGHDVSKIEADLKELKIKIENLSGNHEAFISTLNESRSYACGQSEGEFAKRLRNGRDFIPQIRSDILTIREYYRDVLRPDLLGLKEQIKETNREEVDKNLSTQDQTGGQNAQ